MSQPSTTPRTFHAFECDHMRPVINMDGVWRHVVNGHVVAECSAGVYEIEATYTGEHYVSKHASLTYKEF